MHTASRRLHGATFLIVGALALTATACDSKSAVTTASSNQTPSPTANAPGSAGATATPSPEVKDPAERAVRAYFESLNAAVASMNEAKLVPLMASACECRELAAHIKATRGKGRSIDARYTILTTKVVKKSAKRVIVEMSYDLTKEVVRSKAGKVVSTQAAVRNGLKRVTVSRTSRGWVIASIVTVSR